MDRRNFGLVVGASVIGWTLDASAAPKKGLKSSLLKQRSSLTAAQKALLVKPGKLATPVRLSARRTYAGSARLTTELVEKVDTRSDLIVLGSLLFKEVKWPIISGLVQTCRCRETRADRRVCHGRQPQQHQLKIGTGNGWAHQTFARSEPGHMVALVTPASTSEQTYSIMLTHAEESRRTVDIKYIEVTPTR